MELTREGCGRRSDRWVAGRAPGWPVRGDGPAAAGEGGTPAWMLGSLVGADGTGTQGTSWLQCGGGVN